MDELYLVAFTHEKDVLTHERELKSISFTSFEGLRTVKDIVMKIEQQTQYRSVELMGVTELHKFIDYASKIETVGNIAVPT